MKKNLFASILVAIFLFVTFDSYSQKVGFINSKMIREKFPEAQQAEQRIQSMTDEWKRELAAMTSRIESLEFEIKKNRLVWTDQEKAEKEKELVTAKKAREDFAKSTFEPNGKYDNAVNTVTTPVEEKIYAAVQQVASDQGFDIVLDQAVQPMAYGNYKFDLTLKVLKLLGVDTDEFDKELQEKIDKDPRNKKVESKTPRKRTGKTTDSEPLRDFEQPDVKPEDANKPIDPQKVKEREIKRR